MLYFLPRFRYIVPGLILSLLSLLAYGQTEPSLRSRLPSHPSASNSSKQVNARQTSYSPKTSKVAPELWGLRQEFKQTSSQRSWASYVEDRGYNETLTLQGDKVVVEAVAERSTEKLKASLERLGLEQASTFGRMVSGLLPIARINQLETAEELRFVRPSYRLRTRVGATTSQGDVAQGTDLARAVCDLNGAGTTVGILSDSYNALDGEAAAVASGDLPGPNNPNGNLTSTIVLSDLEVGEGLFGGLIDEGRAMAEIVHDVAPEATLAFHTAALGLPDFANGILRLAEEAEADVIVDDIFYFAQPFFQDGLVAQAADQVQEAGVTYVSAAGNDARQSYESEFRPTEGVAKLTDANDNPIGDYLLHDFDPGPGIDNFQRITIPTAATISFQWSQAFASICPTSPGAESDLDIFILTREGDLSSVVFGSTNGNIGDDPFEFISVNTDFVTEVYIVVGKYLGVPEEGLEVPGPNPNPERIKYIYFGSELNEEYATRSATVYGHPNAAGAIAVGAAPYFNTPAFGVPDPILEPFSSAGGIPILLTPCGEPVAPEVRMKPEIIGPDGGNNTFFGPDVDGDGFPNFFGTSAAAPHVAGLAALMKQADADLSPDSVVAILQNTALDMDDPSTPEPDPGFDFGTGFGLVQGIEALSAFSDCAGIARLELYNADTDELVTILDDGDRISSQTAGTTNLALRAVTVPQKVGSVAIRISGGLESKQIENFPPYLSFGDNYAGTDSVDFNGQEFSFGGFQEEAYTVEAIAYAEAQAQGNALDTLRLSFVLTDELITAFRLIDATTNESLGILEDFQIIDLSQVGNDLNISAVVDNEQAIGSVEFVLEETDIAAVPTNLLLSRTENTPPFTALDATTERSEGSFAETFYLLTATPYSRDNRQGAAGPATTLIFAVSEDGNLPDAATAPAASLAVYPNPLNARSGSLNVRWSEPHATPAATTFRLLNHQGQELLRQQQDVPSAETYQIDIQPLNLPRGVYFLRIERANAAPQVVRILKE